MQPGWDRAFDRLAVRRDLDRGIVGRGILDRDRTRLGNRIGHLRAHAGLRHWNGAGMEEMRGGTKKAGLQRTRPVRSTPFGAGRQAKLEPVRLAAVPNVSLVPSLKVTVPALAAALAIAACWLVAKPISWI